MDRNEKFLKKLSDKEFNTLSEILKLVKSGNTKSLDIKKLTGHSDIYRIRKGNIRVIFIANRDRTDILEISRHNNQTYTNF